jgi:CheY-like chemotaxis protein
MEVKPQILIVEDDREVRETLGYFLSAMGYRTAGAENGHEALELLQGGLRPAVILLDLMMPVMDGWEFREQQLGDEDLARIPVIVTSAMTPRGEELLADACFLLKPIDLQDLLRAIERRVRPRFDGGAN